MSIYSTLYDNHDSTDGEDDGAILTFVAFIFILSISIFILLGEYNGSC